MAAGPRNNPGLSRVLHRSSTLAPPVAVAGDGIYVIDAQGRRYVDACGGAAVSCLGHNHPKIVAAVRDQVSRLEWTHTSFFSNEPMEALADRLIATAPAGLSKAFFVAGGSEAMEAAIKLARQYFLEIGAPERTTIIARRQSYHGNTLGALGIGGNQWRRAPFAPLLVDAHHVSPCFAYRGKTPGESDEAYAERLAHELDDVIATLGPQTVMAFVAETVGGATAGAVPPVPGYFRRVREICDRYGILLILDEVMCGMGRTGSLHACEQEGISPDIMAIAKGLGGGYQPIGAMLVSEKIDRAIADGSGYFQHGHTYLGHPVACAAAGAVLDTIAADDLLTAVKVRGAELTERLGARFGQHPNIGDIRGRGLFQAIELVADRDSKTPFDPALKLHARIKRIAFDLGLMVYPMGGTIDGRQGDHVVLAPPYIVTSDQLGEIVDRLGQAVDLAIAESR